MDLLYIVGDQGWKGSKKSSWTLYDELWEWTLRG